MTLPATAHREHGIPISAPERVYIVLVNWNGWQDTVECLESVFRLNHPDFVVVVCDNASSDGSMERIKAWAEGSLEVKAGNPALAYLVEPNLPKPLRFVEYDRPTAERGGDPAADAQLVLVNTGGNLGFAGGNNVGIRYAIARGDAGHAWLLNNDTVVARDSLGEMVKRAGVGVRPGMVGSTVVFYGRPDTIQSRGGARYNKWLSSIGPEGLLDPLTSISPGQVAHIESRLAYVFGASMLVSRRFLEAVGLMTEDYFLFFEEIDWAKRGERRGFSLGYAPGSLVYHKAGAATGSARESVFSHFFMTRSRLLFIWRFYRPLFVPNYLLLWLETAKAVVKGRLGKAKALTCALLGFRLFRVPVKRS